METIYTHCAGLDVHKKTVVASRIYPNAAGERIQETQTFATMTQDLLKLSDWLQQAGIVQVAMESTGEYWKPVYNILEENFTLLLVNARHIKMVPGRKTDVKDAAWIAQLLEHGLLTASFVPPPAQRQLRDLTRHRANFIRERATLCNRVQKTLESMNIKLGCVATDVMGVSGRAILTELVAGQTDAATLSELAKGRLREKREQLEAALTGRVQLHQRFILGELLCQIDSLDESIARFNQQIETHCVPFAEAVAHLDTIPGVAQATAEVIVAEIGTDMSRFPTSGHLCAWAGIAPGNHQSGGKRLSGRIRDGNRALRSALVQAAWAAVRTKTYLSAQYRRLAGRRGKKRALIAVAHSILKIAYCLIERGQDYQDLGENYFDQRRPDTMVRHLTNRLAQLGYEVLLSPNTAAAA